MECTQIDLYEFLAESELQQYYNAIKNELKINNAAQFKYATDEDLRHIGLSRPEIRRLRKYCEKYFPHGYLSKIKRLLQAPTTIVRREDGSGLTMHNSNESNAGAGGTATVAGKNGASPSKAPNNKHIIPADSISVNKQLGTGEFGIVQQGVWTNGTERIQVAIKCLCRERMQSNPMEFLKEAAIMHSIEHENIVRLHGVVLATDSLMLVTELAHLRSLLECLKDSGLRVSFLTIPTLCEFAVQICNGMNYLEQKRLIHRDLAARNILVFSKNKVKISDFGLSRALGVGKDYYKTNFNVNLKLPIAWCAPECINYLRFTNASDVWAYGVCLWEMFSYGFQPWAALTGLQILEAIDAPNYQRLEQPDCCPSEYYTLMMKCWQDDPTKRPKFNEIYEQLPDMKPEQLKAVVNCLEPKKDQLIYRQGDIITVLNRNTGTPFWKGVLSTGKTGYFNPSNTVAFLEGLPCANRDTFSRVSDHRSSKRKLRTEMISKPQNDFKHTGHVGIDGASFGDIAFLSSSQSYNHVPRQIVTPYKPSEDIEQTPLLLPPTPTSPDSLQTASGYFRENANTNSTFVGSNENTPNHLSSSIGPNSFNYPEHQTNYNSSTNPFAIKSDEEQFAFAMQNNNYGFDGKGTSGRNAAGETGWRASSRNTTDELHEYHEISDDEITADKLDLGPSLLDEINSMFGSISVSSMGQPKSPDFEHANLKNEFTEMSSKHMNKNGDGQRLSGTSSSSTKKKTAGTVKPISVKDEKILNQAIEIANEISARSMIDLVSDHAPATQSPKRKFSFRFPHLSNSADKSNMIASPGATGASGHAAQHGNASPYSKKKNFSEELRSIPDIQRFHSLSEIKNSSDIRIPLFDKESSDFCFEKSREILSRPLALDCIGGGGVDGVDPFEPIASTSNASSTNVNNYNENIMDIEHTLKALNLDFMHTYTELDKSDSNETILNEQFTQMVTSLDDGISSAGSLKSAVYNYSNGVQTMFDFNAATSHLDKHLQYMHNQAQLSATHSDTMQQEQKLIEDKRSSTPDTGFASRDTNISSRRSSQKSSYSPQESSFPMKSETNYVVSPAFMSLKDDVSAFDRFSNNKYTASPIKTNINLNNSSVYATQQLKLDGLKNYRQRSTSFTENFNPVSPVLSEPLQPSHKNFASKTEQQQQHISSVQRHSIETKLPRRSASYKPRSVRARTLRRLSYNPMTLDSSSSSGEDISESNRNLARSECDIRARVSTVYRRRRPGLNRQVRSACHDEREAIISPRNLYGSNSSIKSAPHYNYAGNRCSFNSRTTAAYEQFNYDEKIYDFGGRGPGNNYSAMNKAAALTNTKTQSMRLSQQKTRSSVGYNGNELTAGLTEASVGGVIAAGSGSGSSSTTSTAVPPMYSGGVARTAANMFYDFDVNRLTGKSPTFNFATNSSPDEYKHRKCTTTTSLLLPTTSGGAAVGDAAATSKPQRPSEFHWPEKIHGAAVKQNDMRWLQQSVPAKGAAGAIIRGNCSSDSTSTSSSDSGDEIQFRSEFTPHIPPSPAP